MAAGARNGRRNKCWLPCSRMALRVSQKPGKATKQDKKRRKRKKQTQQTLTHAVTHIRLIEANPGKLDALDQLIVVFTALCQQYITLFCTTATSPDKYADPVFESELSERWQRVPMQQAAGIVKSWRTHRQAAYAAYLEDLADYADAKAKAETSGVPLDPKRKEPHGVNGICQNSRSLYSSQCQRVGGGAIRGLDVRLLATNLHPGQRQSPACPGQTRLLSQKSPRRSHAQYLHHAL